MCTCQQMCALCVCTCTQRRRETAHPCLSHICFEDCIWAARLQHYKLYRGWQVCAEGREVQRCFRLCMPVLDVMKLGMLALNLDSKTASDSYPSKALESSLTVWDVIVDGLHVCLNRLFCYSLGGGVYCLFACVCFCFVVFVYAICHGVFTYDDHFYLVSRSRIRSLRSRGGNCGHVALVVIVSLSFQNTQSLYVSEVYKWHMSLRY